MRQRIAVVGDSLLATFIAKRLGELVGNHVHAEVMLFTRDNEIHYPHLLSVFSKLDTLSKAELMPNVTVKTDSIKSINVSERRIITSIDTYDFERIVIEEITALAPIDIRTIREQLTKLFALCRAHRKEAVIRINGQGVSYEQLAIAIQRDAIAHRLPYLSVVLERKSDEIAWPILKQTGIQASSKLTAGISINEPKSLIQQKKIRGTTIGLRGKVVVDQYWHADKAKVATVLPSEATSRLNIVSATRVLASTVAQNVAVSLGELPELTQKTVEPISAYILRNGLHFLGVLGETKSKILRVQLTLLLEQRTWARYKQKANK